MSTEHKGELLKDDKPDGKLLKKEQKGDLLKSEGAEGNPLWKNDKLNEGGKKKKRLNESEVESFKRKFERKNRFTWE